MTTGTVQYASLLCESCGQETGHRLAYAGRLLVVSTCTGCDHTVGYDMRRRYIEDLRQRVATKPFRMLRRFRRHPMGFVKSLPRTTMLKPLELLEEVCLVWGTRPDRPSS